MSSVFYWLLDQLIAFLANLNPERAKKVEAIKTEAARLDAEYERLQIQLKASELENERLMAEFNKNLDKRKALDNAIAIAKSETQKAKDELDRLTGSHRVRVDL